MKKIFLLVSTLVAWSIYNVQAQGSFSATHSAGDILTSVAAFEPACNKSRYLILKSPIVV